MAIERVVFDTNILISAAISPLGKPFACVRWALANATQITSAAMYEELRTRLQRPRIARLLVEPHATQFLQDAASAFQVVAPAQIDPVCRDPDDDVVLATAVAGRADCIVTGDQDLLVLDPFQGIRILTPAAFLEVVGGVGQP